LNLLEQCECERGKADDAHSAERHRAAYCGKWRVNAKLAGPRQRAGDKSEGAFE
jgi:hypothetical protein